MVFSNEDEYYGVLWQQINFQIFIHKFTNTLKHYHYDKKKILPVCHRYGSIRPLSGMQERAKDFGNIC